LKTYDRNNNLLTVRDPLGFTIANDYDSMGNKTQEVMRWSVEYAGEVSNECLLVTYDSTP